MNDLRALGEKYGTDKVSHGFCEVYHELFKDKRLAIKDVMEIGVFYGASIKMWKDYFPNAFIMGADTFEGIQGNGHIFPDADRFIKEIMADTKFYNKVGFITMNQSKEDDLKYHVAQFKERSNKFNIIIDDGSHLMRDQQITLKYFLPLIKPGGYYIIEDLHSSIDNKFYDVKKDYSNTTKKMIEDYWETGELKSEYIDMGELSNMISQIDVVITEQHGMTAIIRVNGSV